MRGERPASGIGAIMSISPDSSAATRVASDLIGRNSMRCEIVLRLVPPGSVDAEHGPGVGLVALELEGAGAVGIGRGEGRDAGRRVAGLERVVLLHPVLAHDEDAGEIVEQQRVGAVEDDVDGRSRRPSRPSPPWRGCPCCGRPGSSVRITEATTSSAVNGLPSWNFTPWRSLKRQRSGATISHEVASAGSISSFRSAAHQRCRRPSAGCSA